MRLRTFFSLPAARTHKPLCVGMKTFPSATSVEPQTSDLVSWTQ